MIHATFPGSELEASDALETRTIRGLAVPYGVTATVSDGQKVRFLPGSLAVDGRAPKLLEYHDQRRPVGRVTERTETDAGVVFAAKVSKTRAGDDALELALDGVLDSISIGATPIKAARDKDGVLVVSEADWHELSLVPIGAYPEARITHVAAEAAPEDNEGDEEMNDETLVAETPVHVAPPLAVTAIRQRPLGPITAGAYISAMLTDPVRFAEIRASLDTTDDTPGILPEPIVGPVYDDLRGMRPLIDAIGVRSMPGGGKHFSRPKITTHVSVAAQAAEGDALSSTAMVVSEIPLTKGTYGGYVDLSEQVIDFTDPSLLQLVVLDLAERFAAVTEAVACDAVSPGSDATVNFGSASSVVDGIMDAAATMKSASNYLPNAVLVDPLIWAALGKLADTTGRPLFPVLAPSNALGTSSAASTAANVLGLQVVCSSAFAANTCYVVNTRAIEAFEQRKGSIQAANPSTLTTTVAFRGYFVAHTIDEDKVIQLIAD